jgi:hypothetical protein
VTLDDRGRYWQFTTIQLIFLSQLEEPQNFPLAGAVDAFVLAVEAGRREPQDFFADLVVTVFECGGDRELSRVMPGY